LTFFCLYDKIKKAEVINTLTLISDIYLHLIITLFPLFFTTAGYTNISFAKFSFFYITTLIYITTTIVVAIAKKCKPCFKTVHFCVFAYAIITTISAILSEHFPKTLIGVSRREGLYTILLYCAVFVCVSLFGRIHKSHIYSLIGANTLFGIVCILQLLGYNPLGLYPNGLNFYDGGVRYSGSYIGTIGNADLVGAYFCIVIPLLFFVLFNKSIKWRMTALLPLLLLLFTVCKMSVTACVLGLAAALIFATPMILNFKSRGIIIYSVIILSLGITALVLIKFIDGGGFLHELHEVLNGRLSPEFGSNRIRIWTEVWSVIHESPILGKGPDTMLLEKFEKFSTYYPELGKTLTTSIDAAHNEYLNILYHQGILGLISYLGIILIALIKKPSALTVAALAYSVQAFFGISMCLTAPYFWITLALINKASDNSEALALP